MASHDNQEAENGEDHDRDENQLSRRHDRIWGKIILIDHDVHANPIYKPFEAIITMRKRNYIILNVVAVIFFTFLLGISLYELATLECTTSIYYPGMGECESPQAGVYIALFFSIAALAAIGYEWKSGKYKKYINA